SAEKRSGLKRYVCALKLFTRIELVRLVREDPRERLRRYVAMRLSIIDISVVPPGGTRHEAFTHSMALAQLAESLGYHRFWVAEHHGSRSVAGRAPDILTATIAAQTSTIRVGSGSVLLNHYSAFKVAEDWCTLNELHPG